MTIDKLIEKYTKMRSNQEIVYPIEVISDLEALKQPQQECKHIYTQAIRIECQHCGQQEVTNLD